MPRRKRIEKPQAIKDLESRLNQIHSEWAELSRSLSILDSHYNYCHASDSKKTKYANEIANIKNNLIQLLLDGKQYQNDISSYNLGHIITEFANYVIGRCPVLEQAIVPWYHVAKVYKEEVVKGAWPEWEHHMNNDCDNHRDLFDYSVYVLENRWEVFEKKVLSFEPSETLVNNMLSYARHFDFDFKEAEHIIAKFADPAFRYAMEIKKARWPEGEKAILKNMDKAEEYATFFKIQWPEYEHKIRNKPKRIAIYAQKIIKGKLPDHLHNKMVMYSLDDKTKYIVTHYLNYLKRCEKNTIAYLRSITEEERAKILSAV
jgi:uncharacterized protein YifE (UPF0438 family)